MRPRQGGVTGVNDGLHGSRLVDHDEAPRRRRDVVGGRRRRERTAPPVAEGALDPGERFLRGDVPHNGQHGVVGQIVRAVECHQVAAGYGADGPRRAALGHAVGMEAVDQPVEDDVGDVRRIVVADPQTRQHLVALPFYLVRREGRAPRHVGEQIEGEVEAVLHHEDVDEAEIAGRAHAQRAADAVDAAGYLLGGARRRPLIEELTDERGDAGLAGRIGRGAGAQDHPHVDRGLLVMTDVDDAEPVVQGPDLVVREIDVAPQKRRRRLLARPVDPLRGRRRDHRQRARKHREHQRPDPHRKRPRHDMPPVTVTARPAASRAAGWSAPAGCRRADRCGRRAGRLPATRS